MIKKLVSHLGEYKRAAILTPILSALEAIMDVLLPTIMAFIIDQGIEKGDMNAILKYGLLTFLVAVVALALGVLAGKYAAEASTGFAGNLRDAMYENIQHYSFSNIDKFSTAGLVTRMTTDVTVLQNAVIGGFRPMVRGPVMLVMGVALSFWMNPSLAVVFILCAPVLGAILFYIVHKIAPRYTLLQKAVDRLNGTVQEGLTAIRAAKAFVRRNMRRTSLHKSIRR